MTAVDHTITRPTPILPRRHRRLAHVLAKPGWVIMTIVSLLTIFIVMRYLAFNPDTYFPEHVRSTCGGSSYSASMCSPACLP